ncbi:LOW QUALITY PROTEIN: hypothetical protein ACHAWF_004591 [Thalassiosira exigua]
MSHRRLLKREKDVSRKKQTLQGERRERGKYGKERRKTKRFVEVKEVKEQIETLKKAIKAAEQSIENRKIELVGVAPPLDQQLKRLQKLRSDLARIKCDGMEEASKFHVDTLRDDRGFTILMVASSNNNFFTAKVCFDLGANAFPGEGLSAIDFSYFFGFEHVTNLIIQHGGRLPEKQCEAWSKLESMTPSFIKVSWQDAIKIAETAALPAETLMESPEACEEDDDKWIEMITPKDCNSADFSCFESCLIDPHINPDHVKRTVLLDQLVYTWVLGTDMSNFIDVLEGLKPDAAQKTKVHRRAIIGAATTYEVLAAKFKESIKGEQVVLLFTPFVSGEIEGVASLGVLSWARTYIYLIYTAPVFSIWTTATLQLYIVNVDDGDLHRIGDPGFSAKKRVVYSEEQVNKAIFRTSQQEAKENECILASERLDMSSLISGGAGTSKTLLLIKKVSGEEPSRHVLVVSRLPRLVNIIKAAVKDKRNGGVDNLTFTTYDDLIQMLVRRVVPNKESQYESFVRFDRIRFDCAERNISFHRQFVNGHLNSKEKKEMSKNMIDPLTLWYAVTVIKSHAKCALTKHPLSLDDYMTLAAKG